MKWDAWSVVFTGLSLTGVTSVVLFLLVAINPKDSAYGSRPLVYAAGSAILALAFNRASAWAARRAARLVPLIGSTGRASNRFRDVCGLSTESPPFYLSQVF
jgi:hypothetical protein